MSYRTVSEVFVGEVLEKNRSTRLTRYLGPFTVAYAAPFILLECIQLKTKEEFGTAFPWRPYQGIESIQYFFSASSERKAATLVNESHWIAIANGAVSETVPDLGGPEMGIQVWVGLPPEAKNAEVKLPPIQDAPVVQAADGTYVRIIGGECAGTTGALKAMAPGANFLDVYMDPHSEWTYEDSGDGPLIAAILEGSLYPDPDADELFDHGRAILFSDGKAVRFKASHLGARFLLLQAPKAPEPEFVPQEVEIDEDGWVELLEAESVNTR